MFTFILSFDGGIYISQFKAPSLKEAMKGWLTYLTNDRFAGVLSSEMAEEYREHGEDFGFVAIDGCDQVWATSCVVGRNDAFAILNVVGSRP
jgi:hypothetical protein